MRCFNEAAASNAAEMPLWLWRWISLLSRFNEAAASNAAEIGRRREPAPACGGLQ